MGRTAVADPQSLETKAYLFAGDMIERLRANDHKGGWQDMGFAEIIGRIREETDELTTACRNWPGSIDKTQVIREAADIANFCMFIVDLIRDKRIPFQNETDSR